MLLAAGQFTNLALGKGLHIHLLQSVRNPAVIRNASGVAPEPKRAATAEELERLSELLGEVLGIAGYVHSGVEDSAALKIRRLIRRLEPTGKDSEILLGMLRQVRWKLLS